MKHFSLTLLAVFTLLCGRASAQTTLDLQPGPENGKDAMLHGLARLRDTNMDNNPQIVATSWTFQGTAGDVRSALAFDLSDIPQDAEILSASLSLHAWGDNGGHGPHSNRSGSNAGWIQRITSPWEESTVTWNTQPTTTTDNQVTLTETAAAELDYLDMDVTALVSDMVAMPATSHGFLIRLQQEDYYRRLNFCSSDHTDAKKHPRLVVTYAPARPSSDAKGGLPVIGVDVYPNPAKGSVTVEVVAPGTNAVSIALHDARGRLVGEWTEQSAVTTLAVGHLAQGIYYLRVQSDRGAATKQLVLQ